MRNRLPGGIARQQGRRRDQSSSGPPRQFYGADLRRPTRRGNVAATGPAAAERSVLATLRRQPLPAGLVSSPARGSRFPRIAELRVRPRGPIDLHSVRVRYTDDAVTAAINAGIDQLVLLGAGFDTTTLRGATHPAVRTFEVDAPTTQTDKRAIMERLQPAGGDNQTVWVSCDFERDGLREALLTEGFDPGRRSLIIWIGVTAYLTQHAIDATLADLAALCAPGSRLVFDYIDASGTIGGHRSASPLRWVGAAERHGEPFRTRFTPTAADALLTSHGFDCLEHVGTSELLERYAPTHLRSQSVNGRLAAVATAQRT